MPNKPKWLTEMSQAKRIQILTQAHAIVLDDEQADKKELRHAANILWMLKSKYEGGGFTDSEPRETRGTE